MSAGMPAAGGIVHPWIGLAMAGAELTVALTVLATALFGSRELSERAFRLLRWLANRPEPPAPQERLKDQGSPRARPRATRARTP